MTRLFNKRFVFLLALCGFGGFASAGTPPATGDDTPGATTDEALLQSLLGEDDAESPIDRVDAGGAGASGDSDSAEPDTRTPAGKSQPVAEELPATVDPDAVKRLLGDLQTAESNLAKGDTGRSTQTAQSNVVAGLDQLIEAARRQQQSSSEDSTEKNSASTFQPPSPDDPMPPDRNPEETPAQSAGTPNGTPQRNRDEPAEESSDRVRDDAPPRESIQEFRSGLVRDVWGHLPERLRDQLLNAGPDRYLPEYDSLVRDYFESLARPREQTSPQP